MPPLEPFLSLSRHEQAEIYSTLAARLSRSPTILEKDLWVCWVLQALFTMPGRLTMAFKGGTSLSKVFGAIHRFSEDVDITLDYRSLDSPFDPFAAGLSNRQLKGFGERLKAFVQQHAHGVVVPYLRAKISEEFSDSGYRVEISDNGEELRLHYSTVLAEPGGYLGNSVLIEFGGRNITDPSEVHEVKPDIAPLLEGLAFPQAAVSVLSPLRTFWEKATLMHVACQRPFEKTAHRQSRHWYDLAMLSDLEIGKQALLRRDLLVDVVKHKKVFFNSAYAHYDACLAQQLRLIPDKASLDKLGGDFEQMISAGMFMGAPPVFDAIIERLSALEAAINTATR